MKNKYIETSLETKIGKFTIRVYKEKEGKETVVMYTERIDPSQAVLARIHSECLTGDIFKSLRCDCGQQLEQSLKMISRSGNGVLVYLRQEGRGIGLFEKIKAYQLQYQGYDTYEANVMLGHMPDARKYNWAHVALFDLKIKKIRLITNNPEKIKDIEKLGIEVTQRVSLNIGPNKHNKRYFVTKRKKFKHLL